MFLRLIGYLFGIGALLFLIVALGVGWYVSKLVADLPDFEVLNRYEPPVTTRIHAVNGSLMAEYAREHRLYLPIQAIPEKLKQAFIAAEDKNFYSHKGISIPGLVRAVMTNVRNYGKGKRQVGGSTITQQVSKNFLLSNERSIDRKIKEAILSLRIERAYSKGRILELYMNEIFLGLGSYGVAGASLAYFNKSVNELTLAETAYLASLPKAPNNYHPFRHPKRALEHRNTIITRMVSNNFITFDDGEKAKKQPLRVNPRPKGAYLFASEYFSEEVRREIVQRFGEDALYEGGLSIRTTLDPKMQVAARKALIKGLIKYDIRHGYRGPVATIEPGEDWGKKLNKLKPFSDVPEWTLAVVLSINGIEARVGLRPKTLVSKKVSDQRHEVTISLEDMKWAKLVTIKGEKRRKAKTIDQILSVGDVVYVEKKSDETGYRLRQPPKIGGAIIAMDPHTGRVLAMVGGFSFSQSQFNRATQAYRQPGSAFKPFVYAAALDNGYTPSSVVLDAPIKINQGRTLGLWEPKNYGGKYAGPSTLRLGIERSRNLMTVRLAKDMGMPLVAKYAKNFGIYDNMLPVLAMALGSGETTVMRLVSAYAVLANGGKYINPSLIDRIQDRYGKTIFKHEERICETCSVEQWRNQEEPVLKDNRDQVLDPMTAYQITSMMEGVVQRGTAAKLSTMGRPIAGKTGTTNEEKDAWFVGYSSDLTVGVFVGFDRPKPMGRGSTGGGLAAPIFREFMEAALKGVPPVKFRVPDGIQLIPINRKTGLRAKKGGKGVILEAFKPGTRPPDTYSVIGFEEELARGLLTVTPQANRAVVSGTGGLY